MTIHMQSNATMTSALLPDLPGRADPALSAWNRHRTVPSEALLMPAREKLGRLPFLPTGWDGHRGVPTSPLAVAVLNGILVLLVADDGATPQVTPLSGGGVQVEWLVAGDSLQVEASPSGDLVVLGIDAGGTEVVDGEFNYYRPDEILIGQAQAYLEKISCHVEKRIVSN